MNLSDRIHVHPDVRTRFPGFRLSVVFALGLRNGPGNDESRGWIRAGAERGIARLAGGPPRESPSLKNWREAYSSFGSKPSAYPCSAEALVQRVLKQGPDAVPSINLLVDAYNAVSLAHLIPVGGEDLDRIVGRCELRFATQDDRRSPGEDPALAPDPGEVIWADQVGWTCRRWNWRQGVRSRLTESTRNAFFILEGMASPTFEPAMADVARELCTRIEGELRPEHFETLCLIGPQAVAAG